MLNRFMIYRDVLQFFEILRNADYISALRSDRQLALSEFAVTTDRQKIGKLNIWSHLVEY